MARPLESDPNILYQRVEQALAQPDEWALHAIPLAELPPGEFEYTDTVALFPREDGGNLYYAFAMYATTQLDTTGVRALFDHIENLTIPPDYLDEESLEIDESWERKNETSLLEEGYPSIFAMSYQAEGMPKGTILYCTKGMDPDEALFKLRQLAQYKRQEMGI